MNAKAQDYQQADAPFLNPDARNENVIEPVAVLPEGYR
ncbi:hypothetical protein GGD68_002665 [Paraburkholderia fungorum]|jgi:hypothetical protein|uniref:Uncharacterized protein n=1 Tax=Paraburkholderia fungorum TaxID=134537 RepID=A0AAW3UVY2_9BURK|nr:hypothetical protein [Paraburkholderia fungorum]MBB6201145.1 hypothetical protein [Paraburkholderia fungorum]